MLARMFSPVLAFAVGSLLTLLCLRLGVAHASGLAQLADPTPALTGGADAGWATLTQDGPMWLAIAVIHVALRLFLDKEHWLKQGRLLSGLTALAGVLASVVAWHWQGGPSAGIVTALIAGVTLLIHPIPAAAPAARDPQKGSARLTILLWLGIAAVGAAWISLVVFEPGCSNPKVQAVERAVFDCTAPARADAVAAVTPAVVSVIKAAGSADGKLVDISTVKAAITRANVMSEAGVLLSCALASAIAVLETPTPAPVAGAPAAAPFVLDPAAVRATWASIKRDQLGGADFRIIGNRVL